MITHITHGIEGALNFSAALVDAAGVQVDPVSATATVYRVNNTTGVLSLENNIGVAGVVALAQQDGKTGFWGAGADASNVIPGQFTVLFEIVFAGGTAVALDSFRKEVGVDSTNTAVITTAKALEVILAMAMGNAAFNAATRRWSIYGRDGVTVIAYITEVGEGVRTGSVIV